MQLAAVIARYHRGAPPRSNKKSVQLLEMPDRRVALQLSGVLRLANSLDTHNGTPPRLKVRLDDKTICVQAAGYSPLDRSAEEVAAAVLFLVSDEARFLNGALIDINGGRFLR